jgi:ethanolamine ammonia-lyase small subunit
MTSRIAHGAAQVPVAPTEEAILRELRQFTPARIALGRAGSGVPTRSLLEFGVAHAQARDAVYEPARQAELVATLESEGLSALRVRSAAPDRAGYLQRPDLGRRLQESDRAALETFARAHGAAAPHLVLVLADGLSPAARARHGLPLLRILRRELAGGPSPLVVVADFARVALGDEIGELLGAGQLAMLIGERPGLTAPDSLGIYLTHAPCVGRTDAQRNCISNIRPEGLDYESAARLFLLLSQGAMRLGASGVQLKIAQTALPALNR